MNERIITASLNQLKKEGWKETDKRITWNSPVTDRQPGVIVLEKEGQALAHLYYPYGESKEEHHAIFGDYVFDWHPVELIERTTYDIKWQL